MHKVTPCRPRGRGTPLTGIPFTLPSSQMSGFWVIQDWIHFPPSQRSWCRFRILPRNIYQPLSWCLETGQKATRFTHCKRHQTVSINESLAMSGEGQSIMELGARQQPRGQVDFLLQRPVASLHQDYLQGQGFRLYSFSFSFFFLKEQSQQMGKRARHSPCKNLYTASRRKHPPNERWLARGQLN